MSLLLASADWRWRARGASGHVPLGGLRLSDDVVAALTPPPLTIHLALHRMPPPTSTAPAATSTAAAAATAAYVVRAAV